MSAQTTDRKLLPPGALLTEQSANLLEVIRIFEGGEENIYLVDDEGRYRWRAARRSKCRIARNENHGWCIAMSPLAPIVFELPVDEAHLRSLLQVRDLAPAGLDVENELLIVNGGGTPVARLRTESLPRTAPDWNNFQSLPVGMPTGPIYISSLQNPLLSDFAKKWDGMLQIEELNEKNLAAVLGGQAKGTLLYEADIFPDCPKAEIHELYERLDKTRRIEEFARKKIVISDEWASVRERELHDLPLLIRNFDCGYRSIYVCDESGRYLGTIEREIFAKNFPQQACLEYKNICVSFDEDEWQCKKSAASIMYDNNRREVALLQNGRVVRNGVWSINISNLGFKDVYRVQPIYWEVISDELMQEFLGERRTVMLSSDEGALAGFRERFSHLADIRIYDGSNADDYLQGKVEILIYGAPVWPVCQTPGYDAHQLYADLLAEELRRSFERQGVSYYYCDFRKGVADYAKRIDSKAKYGGAAPPAVWTGLREDYFVAADNMSPDKFPIIGGRRQDAPRLEDHERSIYVFGPCVAMGVSAKYGETIEALLQKNLVDAGRAWRVINCGSFGTSYDTFNDLNALYIMMDTHMRRGDIVLQMGQSLWCSPSAFPIRNIFYNSQVLDDPEHRKRSYWHDTASLAHLTAEGYKVWAEYLAGKLLAANGLNDKLSLRPLLPLFSSRFPERKIRNPELKSFLAELAQHRRDRRGAIVMNANPFTLGHQYLIEQARQQVDWLYVFVVEEDRSEITFADRMSMVEANCASLQGVEVIPSGRFIISSLTFTEYFEKETLQEQRIIPSRDVRLFGEAIAPTLGISKRFVGEEPLDKVTQQYNEVMKQLLPEYGVDLIEIPRKKAADGTAINATQVREWLKVGNYDACRQYLPEATINYLLEHNLKMD